MDYLRRTSTRTAAPALFNAWLVDRDPCQPEERAVDVRVLLTRDQLSDLHDVLSRILERAEQGALAPQSFLDQLRGLAAIVSRDPQAVKRRPPGRGHELADLGYMREYIEDLPYQSEVMNLDLRLATMVRGAAIRVHQQARQQGGLLQGVARQRRSLGLARRRPRRRRLCVSASVGGAALTDDAVFRFAMSTRSSARAGPNSACTSLHSTSTPR